MAGMFDPDTFLDMSVEGANETEKVLVPPAVYTACISDLSSVSGERDDGTPWVQLVIKWAIEDDAAKVALNRDKIVLSQYLFIDLDEDGAIATGTNKNVQLGKLRKAVGKNEGRFSPRDLMGCFAKIDVRHVPAKDGGLREEVKGVAAVG